MLQSRAFLTVFCGCVLILSVIAQKVDVINGPAPTLDQMVKLLKYDSEQMMESYRFEYETSDGQKRQEMGMILNQGTKDEELVVMGSYSFDGDDDSTYTVMYTADKNGYRPRVMFRSGRTKKNLAQSLVG